MVLTHVMDDVISGSLQEAHVHDHPLLDLRTEIQDIFNNYLV